MSPLSKRPELVALTLGDRPAAWRALGFTVGDDGMNLGPVRINLGAAGRGILGWSLRGEGMEGVEIDGLPAAGPGPPARAPASGPAHANGAIGLDHVVVLTPDFDRTAGALVRVGLGLRRIREASAGVRQGFRRLGPVILELVEAPGLEGGSARFWGLVVIVSDIDELAARLGDRLGPVKDAVQPGRRIATLRPAAGLQEAVAFMDPES